MFVGATRRLVANLTVDECMQKRKIALGHERGLGGGDRHHRGPGGAGELGQEARIQAALAVQQRRTEVERDEARARSEGLIHQQELLQEQARAELGVHALRAEALQAQAELDRKVWQLDHERRLATAEVALLEGRSSAEVALVHARAQREAAEAQARVLIAEKLPELATAVGQRFGEVKLVQIGGDSSFASIAQAVSSIIDLARK